MGNQTETFIVVGFPGFPFPDGLVPGTTYYWRIDEVNDAEPNSPWKGEVWSFSIPPKTAYFPDPADETEGVSVDPQLGWTGGYGSKLHTVYFGETSDEVDNATGGSAQGSTTYTPGTLKMAKTYYWRVDEFDIVETHKGDIWSFTTANFLIIDDIESYNDINEGEEGSNRIYIAWVDGFDDPTNGSQVGNLDVPIAEQNIVHGGLQSMPMFYDNSVGKSEATLTLTDKHDWTVNSVTTLTIWFRGDSANTPEQMYVTLNGSAKVDHDDPDATTITRWTEWNIPLQAFADQGVNLTNVNSITLGLSSVTAGSGKMYFDDIRLCAPTP